MITFQELLGKLSRFWEKQGCIIHQGYDLEVGAGTMNPATALRCLGPEPYRAAYIEPSRRPTDGRYGTNPNRLQRYYQYQVILKPSPLNMQELYLESLKEIGIDLSKHDIRFVHDDWENPTIGAWGLGWEVWLDGMEVTQYTYFQCMGGVNVSPVTGELTYGIERIAMYLQNVDSIFDLKWDEHLTYGDIYHRNEVEFSTYNFQEANVSMWKRHFEDFEGEAKKLLEKKLPLPAFDFVLKSSHSFNMMDARGAISVSERTAYIGKIRDLAKGVSSAYIETRESLGFPLAKKFPQEKLTPHAVKPLANELLHPAPGQKETFLLEIGSEELPATFVPIGMHNLKTSVEKFFKEQGISHGTVHAMGAPRRLSLIVEDVLLEKPSAKVEKRGPRLDLIVDENGNLLPSGEGFFRSVSKSFKTLDEALKDPAISVVEIKNVKYILATIETEAQSTSKLLVEHLGSIILNLDFPKKMRWSNLDITYARPLRWVVAMLGKHILSAPVGNLVSSNQSWGHRQLDPKPFEISDASSYEKTLMDHHVSVNVQKRKELIEKQLDALEKQIGGVIIERERVIPQVLNLSEWPQVTAASFDTEFLKAPKEVLISEMVDHQKYFPVSDVDGSLKNLFVITADNTPSDEIRKGNQKVLSSRLNDGVFLFEKDKKAGIDSFIEKLKSVTFLTGLGTVFDKTERLGKHAIALQKVFGCSTKEKASLAARLSKADLASNMVYEFPELQGTMGKYYAELAGVDPEVAKSIEEQWMPLGENSPLPKTETGFILSMSDKIDNLIGCFSLGLIPTSSSDPFALRRQTLGIIKMLIDRKKKVALMDVFKICAKHFPNIKNVEEVVLQIEEFFINRIKTVFQLYGFTKDEIEASLSGGFTDVYDLFCKIKALHEFRVQDERFGALLEVYKRAKGQINGQKRFAFSEKNLKEQAEISLDSVLNQTMKSFDAAIASHDYKNAWGEIANLQKPLATLFDEVKILTDEETIKQNRIALLQRVFDLFEKLLDFGKIQG